MQYKRGKSTNIYTIYCGLIITIAGVWRVGHAIERLGFEPYRDHCSFSNTTLLYSPSTGNCTQFGQVFCLLKLSEGNAELRY